MTTARRHVLALLLAVAVVGCGSSQSTATAGASVPTMAQATASPSDAPPSPTPTDTPSPTPTDAPSPTPVPTPTPTARPSRTPAPGTTPFTRTGPGAPVSLESSTNWAGYATYGGGASFSHVEVSWRQPTVTCPRTGRADVAIWVGMSGGLGDGSIEQIGTDATCLDGGAPFYRAWWELVPRSRSSTTLPIPIAPGDLISASVDRRGTTFTMSLSNGHGRSTVSRTYAPGQSTNVEWIVEAPCLVTDTGCRVLPLARFATVTMTGALAVAGGRRGSIDQPIWRPVELMMETAGGILKAAPSGLSNSGTRFGVSWRHQ